MTVKTSLVMLPAASYAVTVMTLLPLCNVMPLALQLEAAVMPPLPPRLFDQVICVTPTLSAALPPRLSEPLAVL